MTRKLSVPRVGRRNLEPNKRPRPRQRRPSQLSALEVHSHRLMHQPSPHPPFHPLPASLSVVLSQQATPANQRRMLRRSPRTYSASVIHRHPNSRLLRRDQLVEAFQASVASEICLVGSTHKKNVLEYDFNHLVFVSPVGAATASLDSTTTAPATVTAAPSVTTDKPPATFAFGAMPATTSAGLPALTGFGLPSFSTAASGNNFTYWSFVLRLRGAGVDFGCFYRYGCAFHLCRLRFRQWCIGTCTADRTLNHWWAQGLRIWTASCCCYHGRQCSETSCCSWNE